jgi:hypothetical protein
MEDKGAIIGLGTIIAMVIVHLGLYARLMHKLRTKAPYAQGVTIRSKFITGNWGQFFSNLSLYRRLFGDDKQAMRLWWITLSWGLLILITPVLVFLAFGPGF